MGPVTTGASPNHHLWRNGRLWWIAFTAHFPDWTKERIRISLGTSVEEARRRGVRSGRNLNSPTSGPSRR